MLEPSSNALLGSNTLQNNQNNLSRLLIERPRTNKSKEKGNSQNSRQDNRSNSNSKKSSPSHREDDENYNSDMDLQNYK